MTNASVCKNCNTPLVGRVDKLFCDEGCRSAWHYEQLKGKNYGFYKEVKTQLSINRRVLKKFNAAGKSTVRADVLVSEGFDPAFFTHYWKNSKNDVYLFCFEYGFLKRSERGKAKFILVQWQDYMKPSN